MNSFIAHPGYEHNNGLDYYNMPSDVVENKNNHHGDAHFGGKEKSSYRPKYGRKRRFV